MIFQRRLAFVVFLVGTLAGLKGDIVVQQTGMRDGAVVVLPKPKGDGSMSLEKALRKRRSVREFSRTPLKLSEVSQLLYAAQGISDGDGLRTAPSAGALYPLEVYLASGDVRGLDAGLYRYEPIPHQLSLVKTGDLRSAVARVALRQTWMRDAPAMLVLAAVYERTTGKYGERGVRYVHMEVGHVSQNIYLQATGSGLGTCTVGAFDDEALQRILGVESDPLAIMPVGHAR